jgi:hypothetical protein
VRKDRHYGYHTGTGTIFPEYAISSRGIVLGIRLPNGYFLTVFNFSYMVLLGFKRGVFGIFPDIADALSNRYKTTSAEGLFSRELNCSSASFEKSI